MFAAGILVHEAVKSFQIDKKVTSATDIFALVLFLVSLPLTYLLINSPENLGLADNPQLKNVLHLSLLFVTFLVLVLSCLGSKTILKKIFSWTPLRWLGNMSYSYYLIHGLTLQFIALILLKFAPQTVATAAGFWIFMTISFTLTWISSTILFVAVEKRFSLGTPAKVNSNAQISAPTFAKIIKNEQ